LPVFSFFLIQSGPPELKCAIIFCARLGEASRIGRLNGKKNMKTQIMWAHIAPHFRAGGAVVFLILLGLVVVIALVFAGSSKDKDR
jgi:hypothetical protein